MIKQNRIIIIIHNNIIIGTYISSTLGSLSVVLFLLVHRTTEFMRYSSAPPSLNDGRRTVWKPVVYMYIPTFKTIYVLERRQDVKLADKKSISKKKPRLSNYSLYYPEAGSKTQEASNYNLLGRNIPEQLVI